MLETTLVTGATGFVGAHLVRTLQDRGHSVRALSRAGSRRDHLSDRDVDWREGDLRDPDSLRRALEGCSALFHCAADYRLFSRKPEELYRSNVEGTRNILKAARELGVRRTVYTSTVGVLGIPVEGGMGDEETPSSLERMVGDYKRSKFLAEEVARGDAAAEMDVVIVNPSTPVGPGDVKPTPTGKMIVDFLNGKMPAYLDTGLNLIAVEDVALGHLLAFERGQTGRRYILGGRNLTLHTILEMLASITGLPAPRIAIPYSLALAAGAISTAAARLLNRPPGIALDSVKMAHTHMFFDPGRAIRELGLPQTAVEEALRRAVAWYLDHDYVTHCGRAATARQSLAGLHDGQGSQGSAANGSE